MATGERNVKSETHRFSVLSHEVGKTREKGSLPRQGPDSAARQEWDVLRAPQAPVRLGFFSLRNQECSSVCGCENRAPHACAACSSNWRFQKGMDSVVLIQPVIAEFFVQRAAGDAQCFRGLRDIALAFRDHMGDVFFFEIGEAFRR